MTDIIETDCIVCCYSNTIETIIINIFSYIHVNSQKKVDSLCSKNKIPYPLCIKIF